MKPTTPTTELVLLMGGDLMLGRKVNETICRYGPAYPLKPLQPFLQYKDFFFANLECAISSHRYLYSGPYKRFYFRADPAAVQVLLGSGINLVSLANNHALDADYKGLLDTLELLNQHQIAHVGAGSSAKTAAQPAYLKAKGHSLGVLGYCDHQEDFAATANQPGICYIDLSHPRTLQEAEQTVKTLAKRVHHVVVSLHWQPNWGWEVAPKVRALAHRLIRAGARVVWGHSPHHFQGIEWLGSNVVLYSTGGLLDDYAVKAGYQNDRQLLFELRLTKAGVEQIRALPIELEFARTRPAEGNVRSWIVSQFSTLCQHMNSQVIPNDPWLHIRPL